MDYVTDNIVKSLTESLKKKNKSGIQIKPFQVSFFLVLLFQLCCVTVHCIHIEYLVLLLCCYTVWAFISVFLCPLYICILLSLE